MNSYKNSVSFLATAGRGPRRAVLWATLRHWLARSLLPVLLLALAGNVPAHVNSGSDGHDGAFNPTTTTNTVIDMADHPDGIYQYTSVNIPANVTVTFMPNANNSPVVWLVQSSCVISGTVDVSGQSVINSAGGGAGGPGGYAGGVGAIAPRQGKALEAGRNSFMARCLYWGVMGRLAVLEDAVGPTSACQGQFMETSFCCPCWEVRVGVVETAVVAPAS